MPCENLIYIIKSIRGLPKSDNMLKLYLHALCREHNIVFYLLWEKAKNEELYDNETTRKELQKNKSSDSAKYLQFLYNQYRQSKKQLLKIIPNELNVEETMPLLHTNMVVVDEIIETLRNIKTNNENKEIIKYITGKMIKDKIIMEAHLQNDNTAMRILYCVFDEAFNIKEK